MFIENLSNIVDDDTENQILIVELGDRVSISVEKLSNLIQKHYKRGKSYIGYTIKGDTQLQQEDIKELKKLLNWNEIPIKNNY